MFQLGALKINNYEGNPRNFQIKKLTACNNLKLYAYLTMKRC